ncbi:hypothetical protein F4818DRAFT_441744 [Hypoxylon cercidicola]|nr:hypothetical protein F4818DRAFT_441744 [Hypoxylon cercidicola]
MPFTTATMTSRREEEQQAKAKAKEPSCHLAPNDLALRIPIELRLMVYENFQFPDRVVTLFMSSTSLREAFGHGDRITQLLPNADYSPIPPSGLRGISDVEFILATRDRASLASIGRTWFPGGFYSTEQILDHPIRGTKLLARPLQGLCDSDCPVGYKFICNQGIPGVFRPQRERFSFQRDTLYLRLSVASPDNAKSFISAMEALCPSHGYWSQVQKLAVAWAAPSGVLDQWAVRDDIARIRKCFPSLRQLTVVHRHYYGESELDCVFVDPGLFQVVPLPYQGDLGPPGFGFNLYRNIQEKKFATLRYSTYFPSTSLPLIARGGEYAPLDIVVQDIMPEKLKKEADKFWTRYLDEPA